MKIHTNLSHKAVIAAYVSPDHIFGFVLQMVSGIVVQSPYFSAMVYFV